MFQLKMSAASCEAECEDFVINVPLLEPADQCCESSIVKEAECEDSVINNIPPGLPPAEWQKCCIYRVPKQLRKVNKEAYTPKLVSIGPFHHGRKELRDMEKHKREYLEDFLDRTTQKKSQQDLESIIEAKEKDIRRQDLESIIEAKEKDIRNCYSDDCRLNSKDFVQMILLDAIFIIELFSRSKGRKAEKEKDYILSKPWLLTGIYYDLILLENQLPFFVLEDLYTSAFNDSSGLSYQQKSQEIKERQGDLNKEETPFLKLSRLFFSGYDKQKKSNIGGEVKHFTDLIRCMLCSVPDLIQEPSRINYLDNLYSATKLEYAGLKFIPDKERRLLDIRFSKNEFLGYFPCFNLSWLLSFLQCSKYFPCLNGMQCILEVPTLTIYADMEAVFRNLIALEQCHYPFKTYICNYVVLMNYLINTEQDVDLLVEKKVIVNYMGSNAVVATLFNKLGIQIWEGSSCYHDLGQALKKHYEHPWNHTLAVLRNMYFGDFGRGIATVAALLTLLSIFVPFLTDIGSKRN